MQNELNKILEDFTKEIDSFQLKNEPAELYQPVNYIMGLGGKRMRPLLTLLAYNLFSNDLKKVYKPALAVELFHNFTLMHDDIMDKAPLRRGKPTVHEKWNNSVAILSGDVMMIKAYDLFMDLKGEVLTEALLAFNKCAAQVCEGQQFDMNFEIQKRVSEKDYIKMIQLKTAALLGFSLELGGILAKTSKKNKNLLRELGINMGMSFQLMDDLLDVYGDHEKFGKQVGGDIAGNKKTFLTIKAFDKAQGEELKKLESHFSTKTSKPESKIKEVTEIYNKLEIKKDTEEKINYYFQKSMVNLLHIDAPFKEKSILRSLAQSMLQREN